jgi:Rieske 2Fe-2S family protein
VPVALETWGGFIFLNFSEKPASLAAQVEKAARMLGRYPFADMRRGAQLVYSAANWKIIVENYECYHWARAPGTLRAHAGVPRPGRRGLAWEDGIPHRAGAWTFTATGTSTRAPFPGLSDEKTHQGRGRLPEPPALGGCRASPPTLWPMAADHRASPASSCSMVGGR